MRPGRCLAAEHGGPELHELSLVEVAVLIAVEHLHQSQCSRPVDAHHLANHRHHLVLTQHTVPILVQLVETFRQLVVTVRNKHRQKYIRLRLTNYRDRLNTKDLDGPLSFRFHPFR